MAEQDLYIRVRLGLRGSDGAAILARRLDDPRAHSYVPDLWDWFARLHPEGQVVGPDAAYLIASGAGWLGDADKFCTAMVAAGFLAVISEGFRVKGWREWAGFHFEVRAKEREKKRRQRQPQGPSQGSPQDVPGTSPGQVQEKTASEGDCPGDPSLVYVSEVSVSKGGAGGRRRRVGIGGNPDPSPGALERWPLTAAALAALWDRKIDALWPATEKAADRVERAISAVTIPVAVERLAASVAADPDHPWLTFHVDAVRGPKAGKGPQPVSQDFSKTLEDVARELEAKHGRPS